MNPPTLFLFLIITLLVGVFCGGNLNKSVIWSLSNTLRVLFTYSKCHSMSPNLSYKNKIMQQLFFPQQKITLKRENKFRWLFLFFLVLKELKFGRLGT